MPVPPAGAAVPCVPHNAPCRAGSRKGRGKPGSKISIAIRNESTGAVSPRCAALGEALQGAAFRQPENSSEPPTTVGKKIKIKAKFTQNGVSITC